MIKSCLHVLVNYGGNRGKGLSRILREKRNTTQPKKQQLSPIRKILGWLIQYLTVQYTVQYSIRCIWVLNAGEKLIFKILKLFFSSLPGVWNKKVYETGNYSTIDGITRDNSHLLTRFKFPKVFKSGSGI